MPETLTYVAVDFERETLADALNAAGFLAAQRSFFSWLGVVPYLTEAAVFAAQSDELDVVQVDYMFLKGFARSGHLAPLSDGLIPAAQVAGGGGHVAVPRLRILAGTVRAVARRVATQSVP